MITIQHYVRNWTDVGIMRHERQRWTVYNIRNVTWHNVLLS